MKMLPLPAKGRRRSLSCFIYGAFYFLFVYLIADAISRRRRIIYTPSEASSP